MRLKITLKSDLCAASGAGFSSIIDNDSCFDSYGLPYIPARRLKGCLREAGVFIDLGDDIIDRIFGRTAGGFGEQGILRISDARLDGYMKLRREIEKESISPESVMSLFGDIRASTAMEGDTAKKNSLRFIRVISKYSPFDTNEELELYSDIELDTTDKKITTAFEKCCKALKNIGYKRNRGLGSVVCTFLPNDKKSENYEREKRIVPESYNTDKEYKIALSVRLRDDLMLPQGNGTMSIDYIPGTMVLGAVAAMHNTSENDEKPADFNDIFLGGKVSFGNLYICDKYGYPSFPAPLHMGKVKETKEIVNMYLFKEKKIVKALKKTYFSPYEEVKVATKTVYHHSRAQQTLYTQGCIEAGQLFGGEIICSGEYAEYIVNLLNRDTISFGRSKNAQYSCCDIVKFICTEKESDTVSIARSKQFAAVLRSDLIIDIDRNFTENTVFEAVFSNESLRGKLRPEYSSFLSGTVSGYNSKWNLKRPHCNCIKAGSVLILSCNEDVELPRFINAGMRCNEGFGRCEILSDTDCSFKTEKPAADDKKCVEERITPLINMQTRKNKLMNAAIEASKKAMQYQMPNPSLVGRTILMAKEALIEETELWENFEGRVNSIKTKESKDKINRLISILNSILLGIDKESDGYTDRERLQAFIYYMNIIKYYNKLNNNAIPEDGGIK